MKQESFFKPTEKAYGGDLLMKRKGRLGGRPLATRSSMHLVLRSSRAVGEWSFRRTANRQKVESIIKRFAFKYGVRVLSLANVGNHLHIHMQLSNRYTYNPFIRAVTAAIAMAITGISRWNKSISRVKFWDRRPFTRIVLGRRGYLNVRDYVRINQFEALGYDRLGARIKLAWRNAELYSGSG